MEMIAVVAKKGARAPMEGKPGYIESGTPTMVQMTPYYRALLRDGSIVPYKKPKKKPTQSAADTPEKREDGNK